MEHAAYTVTIEELAALAEDSYVLCDVRSESAFSYGTIPGSVSCPDILASAKRGELPRDKRLILFSVRDTDSETAAELSGSGYDAVCMSGG